MCGSWGGGGGGGVKIKVGSLKYTCISVHGGRVWGFAMVLNQICILSCIEFSGYQHNVIKFPTRLFPTMCQKMNIKVAFRLYHPKYSAGYVVAQIFCHGIFTKVL